MTDDCFPATCPAGTTRTLPSPTRRSVSSLAPGTIIGGDLRIVSKIGEGGMGAVYLAVDTGPLGRSCAVKILDRDGTDRSSRGRFLDEARIMASLRHPNIVPVSRFGTDDATGFAYYVMDEFLPSGEEVARICGGILHCPPPTRTDAGKAPLTLSNLIDGGKALPERAVVSIALQILSAIEAAHALSPPVIHRDIKPSNILFAPDGRALLADFGIAKRLRQGQGSDVGSTEGWTLPHATPGTFSYAAPEQKAGGTLTAATDCYSFGLVLFRALTGGMPSRTAALPTDIAPNVSSVWRELFDALLEPDPAKRLSDPAAIRALLDRIARNPADVRRRRRMIGGALLALAGAALGLIAILDYNGTPRVRPRAADPGMDQSIQEEPETEAPRSADDDADIGTDPVNADATPENTNAGDEITDRFDVRGWVGQYAQGLGEITGKALHSPRPDSQGRIVVPEGATLLSGDVADYGPETSIVLDGGEIIFSPSESGIRLLLEKCADFIANAPASDVVPDGLSLKYRVHFVLPIILTAKGGGLDHVDGDITALVSGPIRCAEGVDSAKLSVFGLSEITLDRDSIDPDVEITGCGRFADIDADGTVSAMSFFEYGLE